MCYFITAALSANANLEKVAATAAKYDFTWIKEENISVQRQLDFGSSYFYTTKGHCDCSTLLGSANKKSKSDASSKILTLKKKGWSETKIERWLSEKENTEGRKEARNSSVNKRSEIEAWMEFVSEILNSKLTSKISVILHMYSGSVGTEAISFSGKVVTKAKNINEQVFLSMKEDYIYEFIKV